MSVDDRLNALTMEVARHLQTFEQTVAAEHTELRGRMIQQSLEVSRLSARIQVLESKLRITKAAEFSADTEIPITGSTPVAAAPAATPVAAAPAATSPSAPTEPAANHPVDLDADTQADVVDTKITACAAKLSTIMVESHTQVQTSLAEERALTRAYDEKLLALSKTVARLEGIVEDRQRGEGEHGPGGGADEGGRDGDLPDMRDPGGDPAIPPSVE